MNSNNYCTQPYAQKLVDAGIWIKDTDYFYANTFSEVGWLLRKEDEFNQEDEFIPAPCFTEVWKELPELYNDGRKCLMQIEGISVVGYSKGNGFDSSCNFTSNGNLADAVIDLKIWVKESQKCTYECEECGNSFVDNLYFEEAHISSNQIHQTERGWAGHFTCSDRCLFRRNTLLEYNDIKIVVSTVGLMVDIHFEDYPNVLKFEQIACGRYYETMAFHTDQTDIRYHDADVGKRISFNSPWEISKLDADDEANIMHDTVVKEIRDNLLSGERYEID